jgi:hypothetical protein
MTSYLGKGLTVAFVQLPWTQYFFRNVRPHERIHSHFASYSVHFYQRFRSVAFPIAMKASV